MQEDTTRPDASRTLWGATLAWIIPGAGHWYLGQRGLGVTFFLAISFPYWTGLAFGGVKDSVNPRVNKWLFLAEMCAGGYTTTCVFVSQSLERQILALPEGQQAAAAVAYTSYYPNQDVAQIYLAAAGLLNLLAILDAIARSQTGGLPTFHREAARKAAADSGGGGPG